jgi:hypothetical protein
LNIADTSSLVTIFSDKDYICFYFTYVGLFLFKLLTVRLPRYILRKKAVNLKTLEAISRYRIVTLTTMTVDCFLNIGIIVAFFFVAIYSFGDSFGDIPSGGLSDSAAIFLIIYTCYSSLLISVDLIVDLIRAKKINKLLKHDKMMMLSNIIDQAIY